PMARYHPSRRIPGRRRPGIPLASSPRLFRGEDTDAQTSFDARTPMHRRALCFTVLIAATAAFAACDEKLSSIAGPTPNLEPTFSSIQAEIFESTDVGGR